MLMERRAFLARSAAAGAAAWAVPEVLSMDPVAAAVGSCPGLAVYEFVGGLDGWTIFNSWGPGAAGLWGQNSEIDRDGGSLHYGRGSAGNYDTGGRNSGRIRSPNYSVPSEGVNSVTFTVMRDVELRAGGEHDLLQLTTQQGSKSEVLWSAGSDGGTGGQFEFHIVTIPAHLNGNNVRFHFEFDTVDGLNNDGEGIYIGRFEITGCPADP